MAPAQAGKEIRALPLRAGQLPFFFFFFFFFFLRAKTFFFILEVGKKQREKKGEG